MKLEKTPRMSKGRAGGDVFSTLFSIFIPLSKSKIQRRLREAGKKSKLPFLL